MIKTDESAVNYFEVREATPERIERLFNMPDFLQQPSVVRENGLIFAGQGSLLTFDKPSDVINKISAWFPSEVAAARASNKERFFTTYLYLYGPFANWNVESAAFIGLWHCMPEIAWLKPQVNPFRKRLEDPGLSLLGLAARTSNLGEFEFGFCLRNRNGTRRGGGLPNDSHAEKFRRTTDKVPLLLSDKFSRFLSTNRCRGTGPDDCVLILHLWANLSPADQRLAEAIQMLESEIAPDGHLPALHTTANRNAPPSEGEYLRLDSALRRAAFLRAKLLSVLNGGTAWAPQALPATLRQMTALQTNMDAVMDYRFANYKLEYHNEPINPWSIVSSNFDMSPQLRDAVWGEINSLGADIPCEYFDLWFKYGGPPMQSDYVLQRWEQGQPAHCAAPGWEWLKGEEPAARDLRTRYLALLGHGDMDETLLSNFTNNGEDCFGSGGPPGQDWLRKFCGMRISEPQKVSRQLAHSHLALSDAEQFHMTPMQPSPALAEGKVTGEQSKWLMSLVQGMSAESGKQMQAFADDLHSRSIHIMSAKLWIHPQHASSLLELELSVNENSRALLVVEPKGVVTLEIPQRFQDVDGYLGEIAYVSDLDDDGHLELWLTEGSRCHGDMSDLERNLDCTPKVAKMGEVQGRVLSYFFKSPGTKQKPVKPAPQATVVRAVEPLRSADQTCNAILIGTVLSKRLALDFGGGELNDGRGDVIDVVCKPHPLRPEQTIVALFHDHKDQHGVYAENKKGFVFAVLDVARKKIHRLYRDTIEEDASISIQDYRLQIDTARYNLAPGVRALGVRMNTGYSPRCAKGGKSNYLTLFVEEGKSLRPILKYYPMISWSIIEGSNNCGDEAATYIMDSLEVTLSVSRTITNGWHDMDVVSHHRVEKVNAASKTLIEQQTTEVIGKFRASGKNRVYKLRR